MNIHNNIIILNDEDKTQNIVPCNYINRKYEVFFRFNKLDKAPVLAVEVDGYKYHQEGTKQASRDKMKDEILHKYNIPLLRFKTNGSQESEVFESNLLQLLGCKL